MPADVGHRLGRDPEGGDLDGGGQAVDVTGRDDARVDAGGDEGGLLLQRPHEADVVEGGRAEAVDEAADLGRACRRPRRGPWPSAVSAEPSSPCLATRRAMSMRVATAASAGPSPSWRSRRRRRRSSSTAETSASRLRCSSAARRAARAAAAACRTTSVRSALLAGPQPAAEAAGRQQQAADHLTAVADRQRRRISAGRSPCSTRSALAVALRDLDADQRGARTPRATARATASSWPRSARVARAAGEAGDDGRTGRPPAAHPAADQSGEALAHAAATPRHASTTARTRTSRCGDGSPSGPRRQTEHGEVERDGGDDRDRRDERVAEEPVDVESARGDRTRGHGGGRHRDGGGEPDRGDRGDDAHREHDQDVDDGRPEQPPQLGADATGGLAVAPRRRRRGRAPG